MTLAKGLQQFLFLCAAIGLLVIYIRYVERHTIFFPGKEIEFWPKELGLDFEDVFFKSVDELELNGWFLPQKDSRQTILFAHGNAGNISHRLEKLRFFNKLGCSVFIFDYRGYGRSKGSPSEKGLYSDVLAAYEYLLSRNIPAKQIVGYGESLGGAAIIDLAYKHKLKGFIVEGALSSAKDMVKLIYPFLPPWVISSRLDSLNKIKSINTPKLIIHSLNDEIIPFRFGKKLFDNAAMPKEFLQVHGGHNSAFFECEDTLREKISVFLKGI